MQTLQTTVLLGVDLQLLMLLLQLIQCKVQYATAASLTAAAPLVHDERVLSVKLCVVILHMVCANMRYMCSLLQAHQVQAGNRQGEKAASNVHVNTRNCVSAAYNLSSCCAVSVTGLRSVAFSTHI